MDELVRLIKKKKELSDLPDELVADILEIYLKKNKLSFPMSFKAQRLVMKSVRAELRKLTGRFQKSLKSRNLNNDLSKSSVNSLLKSHASTSERESFYPELRKIIIKYNPKSILDLGCGLNPLALAKKGVKYIAVDIKQDELALVSAFFKKKGIEGEVIVADIRKSNGFPIVDVCLAFKVLDIIDIKNHAVTRKLLDEIKCKTFIASFATKTLSGKSMRFPRRLWFERILINSDISFKIVWSENEVFYFVVMD